MVDDLRNIFIFQITFFNFNLQSTATQLTVNLQKIKIFSVSKNGIQWFLEFGPDSVAIAEFDLVEHKTITSQDIPLAAWQLLLSHVSKARFLGCSSGAIANHSKPRGNNGDEKGSTLQCGGSRLGHQQLKIDRFRRHLVPLVKFTIGHGFCVQTGYRHPLCSSYN